MVATNHQGENMPSYKYHFNELNLTQLTQGQSVDAANKPVGYVAGANDTLIRLGITNIVLNLTELQTTGGEHTSGTPLLDEPLTNG